MDGIIAAVIAGVLSLAGTVITVLAANKKTEQSFKVELAVMKKDIEELTREVREHNGFARRLPVAENDIKTIYRRLERIEDHADDGK